MSKQANPVQFTGGYAEFTATPEQAAVLNRFIQMALQMPYGTYAKDVYLGQSVFGTPSEPATAAVAPITMLSVTDTEELDSGVEINTLNIEHFDIYVNEFVGDLDEENIAAFYASLDQWMRNPVYGQYAQMDTYYVEFLGNACLSEFDGFPKGQSGTLTYLAMNELIFKAKA